MYAGMIISYQVAPILKFKQNWITGITHVIENKFFVDEQRIEPYALATSVFIWIFRQTSKNDRYCDLQTPLGLIGRLSNKLFIKKEIESIIEFRRKK